MGGGTGMVAVVTGGTSGIGRACAERFVSEGASVVIAGRRREAGEAAVKALGPRAVFMPTDVTVREDVERLVAETLERLGHIDCFVSNAGAGSETGPIADTDPADLERDLKLHVHAPFLAMKYASPAMAARGRGSFVNVSSVSGRNAGFNSFGYEVAKAALTHLTRCAALELGERGVRVNSVSPGPTLTGIFAKHGGADRDSADRRTAEIEGVFKRLLPTVQAVPGMIRAEHVAAAVWFLASDEARFVNGHDLVVDGGITAGRPASTMRAAWRALSA
jgi:NAD(P)-dependent dehydrogenase (short-subunit alcohol dehydrogenase family)